MRNFGFIKSDISKVDNKYNVSENDINTLAIPKEYSYINYMTEVIDQGDQNICVPCSLKSYIDFKLNLNDGTIKDNLIEINEIYDSRLDKSGDNGMSFIDALNFLKDNGVSNKNGNFKIKNYAIITNPIALKYAIFSNGPCMGGLPVFNYNKDFWYKRNSDELISMISKIMAQ